MAIPERSPTANDPEVERRCAELAAEEPTLPGEPAGVTFKDAVTAIRRKPGNAAPVLPPHMSHSLTGEYESPSAAHQAIQTTMYQRKAGINSKDGLPVPRSIPRDAIETALEAEYAQIIDQTD